MQFMDVVLIKFVFGLIFLFFASLKDFKSREVWDWLSFSFIAFGFLINSFFSVYHETFFYIASSILGFVIAYALSLFLFYMGQWGGGDAKILMAVGSLLGINLSPSLDQQIFYLPGFILSLVLTAWIYGILLVLTIYFKKKDFFDKKFKLAFSKKERMFTYFVFLILIILAVIIYLLTKDLKFFLLNTSFVLLVFVIFYLIRFLKFVESYGFLKKVKIKNLTPGDWVVEKVVIKNPGLSFLDYELMMKYDNLKDPSYLLKLFYYIFHPKRDFKEHLVSKLKRRLMKKMKLSDEKLLHVKRYSKELPKSAVEFMKSEGFLIDSNKIVICSPNSLGLLSSQISILKETFGENGLLKIKEGIPFIPAFFIAFLFQFTVFPNLAEIFLLLI